MVVPRHLFISHSWTYGDQYNRLCNLLNERPYFTYVNYSVPEDDPIHTVGTTAQLRAAIKHHMRPAQVVIVMAGVYATHSKWINEELTIAKGDFTKPVLAIVPWGAERISSRVRGDADLIAKWNTESIVGAIRQLAP